MPIPVLFDRSDGVGFGVGTIWVPGTGPAPALPQPCPTPGPAYPGAVTRAVVSGWFAADADADE